MPKISAGRTPTIVRKVVEGAYGPDLVTHVEILGGSLRDGVHTAEGRAMLVPRGSAEARLLPFKLHYDPSKNEVALTKYSKIGASSEKMILNAPWDPPDLHRLREAIVKYSAAGKD